MPVKELVRAIVATVVAAKAFRSFFVAVGVLTIL
jgi:hypothetical protein